MRIDTVDPEEVEQVDLDKIDLDDLELYANGNPHLMWAALRRRDPVHRHELGDGRVYWSITRYADVSYAFRDHEAFSAERGVLLEGVGTDDPAGGRQIDVTDPPRHRELRDPLFHGLNGRSLESYEDRACDRIRRLVASWPDNEPFDLAHELVTFPMVILGDLMNLPEEDWPMLVGLSTSAISGDDPRPSRIALFSYLQGVAHQRKRDPKGDLFNALQSAEVQGRRLASADVVCNTYNVLLGSNVTLPHTAIATLLVLMERGLYRKWTESPEATTTGLDEASRWSTPANHFLRHTTRDVELSGGTIPAGEAVALWLASANRDEEVFADPYTFDIRRQPNKQLAFGIGSHYCIGYAVAKLSLRLLFEEIIRTIDDMEPAGPVEHLRSNVIAGYTSVPVVIRRRPGSTITDNGR